MGKWCWCRFGKSQHDTFRKKEKRKKGIKKKTGEKKSKTWKKKIVHLDEKNGGHDSGRPESEQFMRQRGVELREAKDKKKKSARKEENEAKNRM